MQVRKINCYSCGCELEQKEGCAPCEQLEGWITVSYWKGKEVVDHYNFCSKGCLSEWVDDQCPRVPSVFLKSFEEDEE